MRPRLHKIMLFVLYGLLLSVLLLPLGGELFGWRQGPELAGVYERTGDTSLSAQGWFDGSYQQQKEQFLRRNFGLSGWYTRLHMQLEFAVFSKSEAAGVVVGKEHYLYEQSYIDAYFGRDYRGDSALSRQVFMLKKVQDTLEHLNKLLLVVLAPGKGSFYPEYIPDRYKGPPARSNHAYFRAAFSKYGINHIDVSSWFRKAKHTSRYPLYPQFGVHWSIYGSLLAFDSLVRYVEHKRGIDMPDLVFAEITESDSLRPPDNDALRGANLLLPLPTYKMAYPQMKVTHDSSRHVQPRLLIVADSYWWYIESTALAGATFKEEEFWYYNMQAYPQSYSRETNPADLDLKEEIEKNDVFVILNTEPNLKDLGRGFIERMYRHFFGEKPG